MARKLAKKYHNIRLNKFLFINSENRALPYGGVTGGRVNSCINENTYQLIAYELRASLYIYDEPLLDYCNFETFEIWCGSAGSTTRSGTSINVFSFFTSIAWLE